VERREHLHLTKHLSNLTSLHVYDTQNAVDLEWIRGARSLKHLNVISGQPITNLSPLVEHSDLADVWIQGSGVAGGFDALGELPCLTDVLLRLTEDVHSLDFLQSVPNVQSLRLAGMESVGNLDRIVLLDRLTSLMLGDCVVDPTPVVLQCRGITDLTLSGVALRGGLGGIEAIFPQLELFGFTDGAIGDPLPLASLSQAYWVCLDRTDVTDLNPIAELPRLEFINLYGCERELDVSPLVKLNQRVIIRILRRQEIRGLEAVRGRHRVIRT
jgi:hypothetical protein